jgi:hypothetical protein
VLFEDRLQLLILMVTHDHVVRERVEGESAGTLRDLAQVWIEFVLNVAPDPHHICEPRGLGLSVVVSD